MLGMERGSGLQWCPKRIQARGQGTYLKGKWWCGMHKASVEVKIGEVDANRQTDVCKGQRRVVSPTNTHPRT
jgi:hypothetical protein